MSQQSLRRERGLFLSVTEGKHLTTESLLKENVVFNTTSQSDAGIVAQWKRARLASERSRIRSPPELNLLWCCAPRQGLYPHVHSLDPGESGYLVGQ